MDFDFGNLIYILIMLAFVIFGAAGKRKKKTLSKPIEDSDFESFEDQTEPVSDIGSSLKKMFGDYMGMETTNSYNDDVSGNMQNEEVIDEPVSHFDTRFDKLDTKEEHKGVASVESMGQHKKNNGSYSKRSGNSFTKDSMKDFNPRKAFLLSEIFNPKYF